MVDLTAKTDAGERLVRIAEGLADAFASRVALHDREASFPYAIDELKRAGYITAPIPTECGGLGVSSIHDVAVASSRLARGDASVALGVTTHLVLLLDIVRRWQAARAAGDRRAALAFGAAMNAIRRDGVVMASAVREPGQDLTRPRATATCTPSGWRTDGSSGHSVTFAGVSVERSALPVGIPAGDADADMERNLIAGIFSAAASLGIAESAASAANDAVSTHGEPDARARVLVAENVIELGACRATLSRAATLVDESASPAVSLFAEMQSATAFVNEAAARIVDRALALSGGAGYRDAHPLAPEHALN